MGTYPNNFIINNIDDLIEIIKKITIHPNLYINIKVIVLFFHIIRLLKEITLKNKVILLISFNNRVKLLDEIHLKIR